MRSVLGQGRDPLCLFLFASLGLAACAGRSASSNPDEHESGAGTDATTGGVPNDAGEGGKGGAPPSGGSSPMTNMGGQSPVDGGGQAPNVGGQAPNVGGQAPNVGGQAPMNAGGQAPMNTGGKPPLEGALGCVTPTPYLGEDTGLESCDGGFVHRATAGKCTPTPMRDNLYPEIQSSEVCHSDEECGSPKERCGQGILPYGPSCIATCESDSDCLADQLCLCDEVNHCVSATCKTDADCGAGLLCTNVKAPCTVDLGAFRCQTERDECTASCPNGPCRYEEDAAGDGPARICMDGAGGTCGRPFLVAGLALTADVTRRSDWSRSEACTPSLDGLTPELRAALAAQYRDAALMEHASVAAFARFTLELLALGAPPELVADAGAAMADEVRHAASCFAVASRYAGVELGPTELDVSGCLGELTLERVVVTTFLEGCIGETIAAVEARESARHVRDPELERLMSGIAKDEARHAALAWRFVSWALARGGARVAARLHAELDRALSSAPATPSDSRQDAAADAVAFAQGLVPAAFRASARREALEDIVAPCLAALCPARSVIESAA